MEITILGSGTSTGVPMVGCKCPTCSSDNPKDIRTRASLLIRHNRRNILIDTSTDLRLQLLREGVTKIDAVLFTHSHADHVNGIDDLRGFYFKHKEIIPCFASCSTLESLEATFSYIFKEDEISGYTPLLSSSKITAPFDLFDLTITPVPLIHGNSSSLGYRIGNFAYLTDCSSIPDSSLPLLKGLDFLVIDGLRWSEHPFHFNIKGAIQAAESLASAKTILTHLTHEVMYDETIKLPAGVEFAYDGMTLHL